MQEKEEGKHGAVGGNSTAFSLGMVVGELL